MRNRGIAVVVSFALALSTAACMILMSGCGPDRAQMQTLVDGYLVSIEDESKVAETGAGKGFKDVYEKQGLFQVEEIDVGGVEELESVFFGRIFKKVSRGTAGIR